MHAGLTVASRHWEATSWSYEQLSGWSWRSCRQRLCIATRSQRWWSGQVRQSGTHQEDRGHWDGDTAHPSTEVRALRSVLCCWQSTHYKEHFKDVDVQPAVSTLVSQIALNLTRCASLRHRNERTYKRRNDACILLIYTRQDHIIKQLHGCLLFNYL